MAQPDLSVVIPAYNEEAVVGRTVQAVDAYLTEAGISHEIVVVDDGSTDRTTQIVRAARDALPSVRLVTSDHRGKGAAVRRGMLDACGQQRLFMDADHSTNIREWEKCAPWFQQGHDVVIGSRKMPGANVRVHQPRVREGMGEVFTWLTNTLLAIRVTDITCGFKAFSAAAAHTIFRLQRIEGWGFDAEILFLTHRNGFRIKEVPVVWADDPSTKVRLVSDAVRSFSELLTIRLGAMRGWYERS